MVARHLGLYKNLRKHRTELGWTINELLSKSEQPAPSERSVRRLENGEAIRIEAVHKLFNTINKQHGEKLERSVEIVASQE